MTILMDQVRISGFRGLSNFEISLPKLAVLIGPNNCGKTSVLKAIQLAIGDYSRYLSEEDFHIDANDQRSAKIDVDVRFISTNSAGVRTQAFEQSWQTTFGDKIRADPAGNQMFAFRTTVTAQPVKSGYLVERFILQDWRDFSVWLTDTSVVGKKFTDRTELTPFISIDAQRDIHTELNERTSFVGRVLSTVKYEPADVAALETMISQVNSQAVAKSAALSRLKGHLDSLNASFGGNGVAEVTPFPKKMRDLSRRFSVHFGNTPNSSFSMEYHGMGTRSWASMLAVKAFSDLMAANYDAEAEPYHPILGAEEPEAHLHPNAQRSLFAQLSDGIGQTIVSTHSPYLAAMCAIDGLRSLSVLGGATKCRQLIPGLKPSELALLNREVIRNKGETLYCRAMILFEGQTEEQVVPAMFQQWFGTAAFQAGVNLISVNGQNYSPYVKLAGSFGIPVFIVSDNDKNVQASIQSQIAKIPASTSLVLGPDWFGIEYLGAGNDFEAELVLTQGLQIEIRDAFIRMHTEENDSPQYIAAKQAEFAAYTDADLIDKMRKDKTGYSAFLFDVIAENKIGRTREQIVPPALQVAFEKVRQWLN